MEEEKKYLVEFFESTFMYFRKTFTLLNMTKFNIIVAKNEGFNIYLAYSYDGTNYSEFKEQKDYEDKCIDDKLELYVCVMVKRFIHNDLSIATRLFDTTPSEEKYWGNYAKIENVNQNTQQIIIESISYDNGILDVLDISNQFVLSDFEFNEYFKLVDEFPRWNFYDNQENNIFRWLETCNSIAEMYGHTCIYFKTEPVQTTDKNPQSCIHGTHHTLQNNVIRNVVDIKKLHILCPNNELPQDRTVFTEWDMPLQDDFLIHIVRQKFEQAFGLKTVPNEKDYIYFPIINKLFRVSTMQPKNGFMGVCGWYEVFLAKYEEDDCVHVSTGLRNSMGGIPGVTEGIDILDEDVTSENFDNQDSLWDSLNEIKEDTILTEQDINQVTIEEKKEATQSLTNKLEDTTFYVSLKETEKLRELYDKRLSIVSVNPDDSLYPITMYNCSDITKRTIALQYSLSDYSVTNKFSTLCKSTITLNFNFVLLGRHSNEVFDVICNGSMTFFSLSLKNNKFVLFDTSSQEYLDIPFTIIENELYQISVTYDISLHQYSIKIFRLKDKQKTLEYQNIYIVVSSVINISLSNLQLFGGKFLVNDVQLIIDKQKFIDDKCLPLLNMYKF